MRKLLRTKTQGGFVVGTELLFLLTCMLCIAIIAWSSVGSKIVAEISDIGSALGKISQEWSDTGMAVYHVNDPIHNANNPIASWSGSSNTDYQDFCDQGCNCGIVMCIPSTNETGLHP